MSRAERRMALDHGWSQRVGKRRSSIEITDRRGPFSLWRQGHSTTRSDARSAQKSGNSDGIAVSYADPDSSQEQ
jgi:hypothetical protein